MQAPSDIGFFEGIVRDLTGDKGQLRLVLQPLVAIFLGSRLGVADAKERKHPFLFRLFQGNEPRSSLFKDSLADVVMPISVAILLDCILQHYTLGFVRPFAAVIVGMVLVWLPYAVSRALTNRAVRRHYAEKRAAT
ncbi:MAG: hypothetical protein SFX73_26680 [Kofleriaceae bacterium]|nr:hypothetical protein [Kofleriaceae bacterium]